MSEIIKSIDGAYQNVVTGMGTELDADSYTTVKKGSIYEDEEELSNLYAKDPIVKSIVDKVPESFFNNPISIVNDEEGKIYKELSELNFFNSLVKAVKFSRLYNGSIIVTLYENDDDFAVEAKDNSKIYGYRVYSSARLELNEKDWVTDKENKYFGSVEFFNLKKLDSSIQKIHASRINIIDGELFPDGLNGTVKQQLFGLSLINSIKSAPQLFGTSISTIGNMLKENGVSVFGFDGFWQKLMMPDGENAIRKRMGLLKAQMSSIRGVVQDSKDTISQLNSDFSGIPEIMRIIFSYISSASNIPVSILFGNMISGLSSTNEGDIRIFNELVEKTRENKLYKVMCLMISDFAKRNLGINREFEFEWGSVGHMTQNEKTASLSKIVEIATKLYSMDGVISVDDIKSFLKINGSQFGLFIDEEL